MDDTDAQNPIASHEKMDKPAPSLKSWFRDNSADLSLNDRPSWEPDFDDIVHGQKQLQPESAERMLSEGLAEQSLLLSAPAPSELPQYDAIKNPTGPSQLFLEMRSILTSIFNNFRGYQVGPVYNDIYYVSRNDTGGFYLVLSILIIMVCLAAAIWIN